MLAAAISSTALASGCGSRTSLQLEEEQAEPPEQCLFDEDCPVTDLCRPARCVSGLCETASAPIACDDADPCTDDACNPSTGQCRFRPVTADQDGDGFNGPRAGYAPGAPEACGDDCDDASGAAFPGGVEACDGVDNDCNGVIDDGARYHGVDEEAQRLSQPSDLRSGSAGLASDGERWGVTLWGEAPPRQFRFLGISTAGEVEDEKLLTNHNGGSYGGPLVWTGAFYGIAWNDNRQDENVEMYFNRIDRHGDKLGPDLRLTNTPEFSLSPSIYYDGNEFLVFWNDFQSEVPTLWGQRISLEGEPIGELTRVSPEGVWAESASLDFSTARVGASVKSVDFTETSTLNFVNTDREFTGERGFIQIDTDPDSHQTRFLGDRFVVVWSQLFQSPEGPTPGQYIYGASFDEFGNPLSMKTALTPGGVYARGVALLSLGDRALLFWSDDSTGNFQIFVKTIDRELNELTPPERLTFGDGDSFAVAAAFGPDSQAGVVFDTFLNTGGVHAYMVHLSCDNQ